MATLTAGRKRATSKTTLAQSLDHCQCANSVLWTALARWKLDAGCGQVLVSGILTPDFEKDYAAMRPAEENGSYWAGAYVEVPPDTYQVEVYSYPPGDLSGGWDRIVSPRYYENHPGIKPEKELDYFRRTRPSEKPPGWIEDEADEGTYINFLHR